MKNVLVTGAAGFIGANLAYYLKAVRPDWKLYLLDALTYAGNLSSLGDLLGQEGVEFIKSDITNDVLIDQIFEEHKFELVFHLAAESHVDRSIHSASEFINTNVLGTQNLLNSARNHGVARFVHVSTDEVYGTLGPEGQFTEETPLDPTSPYAASKAASDLLVLATYKTHGLDAVITRCTNNFGPYQFPEKMMPLFITNALEDKSLPVYGDGGQIRHWVYVEDHNRALLDVAEKGRSGEVYNIGGMADSELSNLNVTKSILEALGKPESLITRVKDRLAHDRRYSVDITKINQELGWEPQVDFKEGLQRTIAWYLDNKSWWEEIKSGEYQKFYDLHYGQAGL